MYWNDFHLELMLIRLYYIIIKAPKQENPLVRRKKLPVTLKKEAGMRQNDAYRASFSLSYIKRLTIS
jgi:hypothetical protein